MKNNLSEANIFANKVRKLNDKHILIVVLFGSVSRGEDTVHSDIDIAIIHDGNEMHLRKKLDRITSEKIQLSYFHIGHINNETEILHSLTGEGLILYGRPFQVTIESKIMSPKIIINYNTKKMKEPERMKLNRALNGGISKSVYKGKTYSSEVKGLVAWPGITKLARSVLIVEPSKAHIILGVLKRYGADWKEISVWS